MGCDDVPMAAMVSPPLTTVHLPTTEAGVTAVQLLQAGSGTAELYGEFVLRGSTGPVTSRPRGASGGAAGARPPSGAGRG